MLHDYFNFENDLGYILIQDPTIIQDSRILDLDPRISAKENNTVFSTHHLPIHWVSKWANFWQISFQNSQWEKYHSFSGLLVIFAQ